MQIDVDKSQLNKLGTSIKSYASSFSSNIRKIKAVVGDIDAAWDGENSVAYINTMNEKIIPGLEELQRVLNTYGDYLKNVGEAYEALDEAFSSKSISV